MNEAADPVVVVRGLSRAFGDTIAVDELSFDVRAGEVFGLVGPDGAGKTTTLRMLAGVLAPDGGTATIAGHDVTRGDGARLATSYMPQRFGLYEDLTVDENIRFYADLFDVARAAREARAAQLLAAAGIADVGRRLAGQLSGGMKQKLGLVCALIHTPRVLLLDEPTNGVDPVSRREFWRILYALTGEGVAVLASTAYLDEAERCHRVALLHCGKLLFCDTPARLKARIPGGVIAVTAPDPRRARAALDGADGVRAAVLVGDGVHLMVDDPAARIDGLRARLAQAGVAAFEIAAAAPSMEDLFVDAILGRA